MDFVISILAKTAEYTVEPVGRWLCYSFQYKNNIENLRNRVEDLQHARERVQHSIDIAPKSGEEIENDVKRWLTKANEITTKAREVLEGGAEVKSRSSNGECLRLKSRHQLSQKAKKIVQVIDEDKILEKGRFDRVFYHPPPQGTVALPHASFLTFESRKSTELKLMEALQDANTNVIGVWGSGGVGKTTLVMKVIWQAEEEKLFDEFAMADLTQSPDIRQIQGEIADMLDLKLDAETERGRAKCLLQRLTEDKKILIVLDNIWKKLDWEEIGIPCKGCKVILISRNRDVLYEMGIQKDFGLESLPKEEAWSLFTEILGNSVEGSDFLDTANKIVRKCAGLPIALVTVSKALKNKSLDEWEDALRQLERLVSPEQLTEMQSTIYSCIKLSYGHLESREARYFFLYCAGMSYGIFPMDLLKYSYGLGLFSGINTLEEARNNICRQLRNLKDVGLLQDCQLLHCSKSKHYHMHDVVRYVGRLIASKEYNMNFVGEGDTLKKWCDVDAVKRWGALFIFGENIDELGKEIILSELRFLLMYGRDRSLQISDTFFQEMEKLRVLDFTHVQLSSIPLSLSLLTNLRTLCLDGCILGDITLIGKLKNLTILSLIESNISELPREIGLLTHLQLLDLSYSSKLEVIPSNVLSSLVELEELYLGGTSIRWELEGVSNERNGASLIELKHLSKLNALEVHIQDACDLPKDLRFDTLKRYKIFIGNVWRWSREHETSRILKLKKNVGIQLEDGIRNLLKKAENLCLDESKGINSALFRLDWEGFQYLKYLQIQNNLEIKYIIDSTMFVIAFPKLEKLILKNMFNLEETYHGQLRLKSFCNLRVVKIEHCDKLEFFVSSSMANGLSVLEELEIKECNNMSAIVAKEEGITEGEDATWFPQLRLLVLKHLPKLKGFLGVQNSFSTNAREIMSKSKPDCYMQILQEEVVFPNLEKLELSTIHWEEVQQKDQWPRSSCRSTSMTTISGFQNLLSLIVRGSGNMKHLLSFCAAKSMVRLKYLEIRECNVMEEILLPEDLSLEEKAIAKTLLPQLETLYLIDLPFLNWFWKGSTIRFLFLKKLKIERCPKFKTFIWKLDRSSMAASKALNDRSALTSSYSVMEPLFNEMVVFPKLEVLVISHLVELKKIWHEQFVEKSFCKLRTLVIELCENLTNIFQSHVMVRFQSLSHLRVSKCDSLQEVFELQRLSVEAALATTAIQLKTLVLRDLPKMRRVWNKDPHPIFTFQDLQEIHIWQCESLESLFPTSLTRSLTQLKILSIFDCGVEEIVAREDVTKAIDGLVFPQVTHLLLLKLPRLEWFHPEVYTVEWPKLKKIWVGGCLFDPTLSSFEELKRGHHETSNKQLYFLVDKAQAKVVDSTEEFAEDINNSVVDWS